MSLVIGGRIFQNKQLSQWIFSYIGNFFFKTKVYEQFLDILHRLKLWNVANEIIKNCNDPQIKSINQVTCLIF